MKRVAKTRLIHFKRLSNEFEVISLASRAYTLYVNGKNDNLWLIFASACVSMGGKDVNKKLTPSSKEDTVR